MKVPDGYPLVKGRFVTGFANSGEAAIELMQVVPFLVEDMLKRTAASIRKRPTGHPHVVVDGNPITGQNPASAEGPSCNDWPPMLRRARSARSRRLLLRTA
jgi:putative intracellular protease/amidase